MSMKLYCRHKHWWHYLFCRHYHKYLSVKCKLNTSDKFIAVCVKLWFHILVCIYAMRLAAYHFSVFEYHAYTRTYTYIRIPSLFVFGFWNFPYTHTHTYTCIWILSFTECEDEIIGINFKFFWILSMCKLRRITHKLNNPKGFMLSLWVIRRSLYIDKIHKNNNSFLIIPTLSSESYFVSTLLHILEPAEKKKKKKNSSEILAHRIYRSVKLFLQPDKLHEVTIMMRSWNYIRYQHIPGRLCNDD